MLVMSPTGYNHWHQCQRLYYFEDVLKLERVKQDGARFLGKMFHDGQEAWWKSAGDDSPWRDPDEPLVAATNAIALNARHIDTDRAEVAKAEAMMTVYHHRYFELRFESPYTDGRDDVEMWFRVPLLDRDGRTVPGWLLVGKKDAFKRFADGRVRPAEHKTTSSKIHLGSDYWARVAIDTQVSIYIDAAQRTGYPECNEVLYDVVRTPKLERQLATPEADREYTKGKGCKECGGRAGGKLGVAKGTGAVMRRVQDAGGRDVDAMVDCPACKGTGWDEAPRLHAKHRLEDEPLVDYKSRIMTEMSNDPDAYFKQAHVPRSREAIGDMRDDLNATTGLIGGCLAYAEKQSGGNMFHPDARACFSRNTQACTSIYGRRCDFLDVCSGTVQDPLASPLYRIRKRKAKTNANQTELELPRGETP